MSSLSIPLIRHSSRNRAPRRFAAPLALMVNLASRAGHLLRTTAQPYHLTTDCGNGGGPAPCVCTWPMGLASTYTVSGWNGLSACGACDASAAPLWSGVVHHTGSGCVWWAADSSFDPLSISGATLDITYTQVLLNTTVSPCRWELYIACASVLFPTKTMWYGYKTTGATPAGTYAFAGSDCGNAQATMTVS